MSLKCQDVISFASSVAGFIVDLEVYAMSILYTVMKKHYVKNTSTLVFESKRYFTNATYYLYCYAVLHWNIHECYTWF